MATIKDVARLAGVSISTVSRALSGKAPVDPQTKSRVLDAVSQLDYHPNILARGLKNGSTNTIGLIIPDIGNPVFPASARGVEDEAHRLGYNVIFCSTDGDTELEMEYIKTLRMHWVDGIVIAPAKEDGWHLGQLSHDGFPHVMMVRHRDGYKHSVMVDNYEIGYMAASHLIDRGCRRIGIIAGDLSLSIYRDRMQGYRMALADNAVSFDSKWVVDGSKSDEDGRIAAEKLIKGTDPVIDGIFAMRDYQAMGVVRYLNEKELRMPQDVCVVGIDNFNMYALMTPSITGIRQPLYKVGVEAVKRLIEIIEGRTNENTKPIKLNAELIAAETT